jgi:chromatin segregation and condensation protein Rec8/ScpA/Scc1 (kleisin family)
MTQESSNPNTTITAGIQQESFWKDTEYAPLVNKQDLKRVANEDPWQYEVSSRLKSILYRMESRKAVNFRMSGIVLHSASLLCRAKSRSIVDQGSEIQDSLAEEDNEDMELNDDEAIPIEYADLSDDEISHMICKGKVDVDTALNMISSGKGSITDLITKERLENFAMPKRVIAKQVTISDLSIALNDALSRKFRKKNRRIRTENIVLPEAITNSYSEELKVEQIIELMNKRIKEQFLECNQPVPFLSLFNQPKKLLVVKTFLAILHMINKKMIEAWQIEDGEIVIVPYGKNAQFCKTDDTQVEN